MMKTIDFKKDPIYKAKTEPSLITVPEMLFIMVDGVGAPEVSGEAETDFQKAMQALFGVVYGIKFWGKKYPTPIGYTAFTMAPIEALWWTKSGKIFDLARPQDWQWSVMLRVPEFVTPTFFGVVVSQLMKAKPDHQYQRVMLAHMNEGLSVQIMHIGPYAAEQTSVDKLYAFAKENNLEVIGKHHELYFGDPRRTAPDKLRTILRLAVKKVS